MIVGPKNHTHDAFDISLDLPPAYDDIDPLGTGSQMPTHLASGSSANVYLQESPSLLRSRRDNPLPRTPEEAGAGCIAPQKLHRPSPSFSSNMPKRDKLPTSAPLSPKAQNDVRETVRGLVRDVVQGSSPVRSSVSAALGVLESCANVCSRHSISFARILQERSIEHHAPIYWAIVSRPAGNEGPNKVDYREHTAFLIALLGFASPLAPISVSELRAACLVASSNALFQHLRSVPGVIPLLGTERMLLSSTGMHVEDPGGKGHPEAEKTVLHKKPITFHGFMDVAQVHEGGQGTDVETFGVNLEFRLFQRQMRISGKAEVEFIARGRLWQLIFFVVPFASSQNSVSDKKRQTVPPKNAVPAAFLAAAKTRRLTPGSWAVGLALLEDSTQCCADARLIVSEPRSELNRDRAHPRSATAPGNTVSHGRLTVRRGPGNPSSSPKLPKRPFFRRTASEDKNKAKGRLPIILNLTSTGTSPLIALPSPSNSSISNLSDESNDLSLGVEKSKRRPTREEKRAARAVAKKEKRAEMGRETKRDKRERARLAKTVLIVGLEESGLGVGGVEKSSKKDAIARGEELMYDGCPYISPDGMLRAVLEARLGTSPPESNDSGCVIC